VNGKKETAIPVNAFLGERKCGSRVVSRNLEKEAVEHSLRQSYRGSEDAIEKKLGRETIRKRVIGNGEKAGTLEKTRRQTEIIEEKNSKDAGSETDHYKKSRGGPVRNVFAKIFGRRALYFMADGVGVERQYKSDEKRKGKRECKVGVFLSQAGEAVKELGTFCTWGRVNEFGKMAEWLLLKILMPFIPVIIISDGAKWIRNLRNKIPRLKKAVWILDWFHLKDNLLALFRVFGPDEESQTAETATGWLWRGNTERALEIINRLPFSDDENEKKKQAAAVKKFRTYLKNQKEGIVNYQAYKMRGYLAGSGYMEKRNDTLIKNRMVRQGRMRWGLKGGEAMMQLLTARMNGRLDEVFA